MLRCRKVKVEAFNIVSKKSSQEICVHLSWFMGKSLCDVSIHLPSHLIELTANIEAIFDYHFMLRMND